jgi:hypothetical protein
MRGLYSHMFQNCCQYKCLDCKDFQVRVLSEVCRRQGLFPTLTKSVYCALL